MGQSEKIKSEDIIESNLFDNTTESAEKLDKALSSLEVTMGGIIVKNAELMKLNAEDSKTIKENTKLIIESEKAQQALLKTQQLQIKVENEKQKIAEKELKTKKAKKIITAEEIAQRQIEKKDLQDLVKLTKARMILEDEQAGQLEKLNAENTILRINREKLRKADANYVEDLKKINDQIDKNNTEIKENSDQLKQQKLNVGNYTESIKDAINGTGIFSGALGDVANTLKLVRENLTKASTEGEKFGTKFKIGVAGAIAIGIALIKKAFDDIQEVSQNLQDQTLRLNFAFAPGSVTPYIEAMRELRPALLAVSKQIQAIVNDEGDFNEIVQDQTVSLSIRNKALERASQLSLQRTALEVEQARLNLDVIDQEIKLKGSIIGQESVLFDLKQKRTEAENALSAAIDNNSDIVVQNERRQRQLFQEALINDIEILRSNKLNSNARIQNLQKEVADEKKQLEERSAAQKKVFDAQKKTTEEEFKIFQRGVSEKINMNEILLIQDQALLKNYIRKNISSIEGTELETELFKIIKQAQDSEIENQTTINKLKEEQEAIDKRLLEIRQENFVTQEKENLRQQEEAGKDLQLTKQKQQEKIFQGENVFRKKQVDNFKKTNEALIENEIKVGAEKVAIAEAEAEFKKQKIEAEITDNELKAAELAKIDKELAIEKGKIQEETLDNTMQIANEEQRQLIAIEKKRVQLITDSLNKITQATGAELDKRNQKQQDQFDRQISGQEKVIETQRQLAADGQKNTLAIEEARLAKQQLKKQEAEEKAARQKEILQLTEAYYNAYNAELQQPGGTPSSAAAKAFTDVLLAKGVAKGLVQFALHGNDYVEPMGMGGQSGVDDIPFLLTKGEGVVNAEGNEENPGVVSALNKGIFSDLYIPRADVPGSQKGTADNFYANILLQQNAEIKSLLNEIADKPVQNLDINKFGEFVETVTKRSITEITTHKKSTIKGLRRG